jgi:hypothetical protein
MFIRFLKEENQGLQTDKSFKSPVYVIKNNNTV